MSRPSLIGGIASEAVRRAIDSLDRRMRRAEGNITTLEGRPYSQAAKLSGSGTAAAGTSTSISWTVDDDPDGLVSAAGTTVVSNGGGLWLGSATVDGAASWAANSRLTLRLGLDQFVVALPGGIDRLGATGVSRYNGSAAGIIYNAGTSGVEFTATLYIVRLAP